MLYLSGFALYSPWVPLLDDKQYSILRKIAHQKRIRGNLNLPYKTLESTLSRDLSTEWSAEKASHADIIIHHYYHPPHRHRHHNHHQHPHHYDHHHYHQYHLYYHHINIFTIITIIIIIIFTKPFSSSSPSSSSSSSSLLQLFGTKHVEKVVEYMSDSVEHHCYFISHSSKPLQVKKKLNFNMQKITSQSKLCINCTDCGTVYAF